jgi:carbonic anhydrase/acetyltransferase-like protein (isoleucine patch superfamily)
VLIEHDGHPPSVAPSAYVAPTAVVCGEVSVGEESSVLFGAVVVADGGPVTIGRRTVVMEQAVVRGREGHPVSIGQSVLIGPHAHVNGAVVENGAFVATGASVFPGARIGPGAEVRINGVVHVNTSLPAGAVVPIGWVAVGDPAEILPPSAQDRIWAIQRDLDFVGTVYGIERTDTVEEMAEITRRYAALFARHRGDRVVE